MISFIYKLETMNIKNYFTVLFFLLVFRPFVYSQSTLITPGNGQAAITATSINSGVNIPKVTLSTLLSSPAPVTSPVEGLLVYNIGNNQAHGFYYWNGSLWTALNITISNLTATAPLNIQTNNIKINSGTAVGQLMSWDGFNWVFTNPKQPNTFTNLQPYLAVNYCIALQGVFPSRNGIDPFIGEIMLSGFNFEPRGWAFCNGQLLPISQNTALFALLGTTFGGNGQTTFALPDLRSRVPLHFGQGPGLSSYTLGQSGGVESTTINDKY
jgi:microcystin-dependent protein